MPPLIPSFILFVVDSPARGGGPETAPPRGHENAGERQSSSSGAALARQRLEAGSAFKKSGGGAAEGTRRILDFQISASLAADEGPMGSRPGQERAIERKASHGPGPSRFPGGGGRKTQDRRLS